MKILHSYILRLFVKNLAICVGIIVLLFLVFDFFDRIDNILPENPKLFLVILYYLYKVPVILSQTFPIAVLASTMLTVALLSKNSELIAMRATGATVFWITKPILTACFLLSFGSLLLQELIVPSCLRRLKEIYNIDIMKKDKRGGYSQSDFWWRSDNYFFTANQFDSRSDSLLGFTQLEIDSHFNVTRRINADRAEWIDQHLGWSMKNVVDYKLKNGGQEISQNNNRVQPLPIRYTPRDFFSVEADPLSMSYFQMRDFIDKQKANGLDVSSYLADLYNKFSSPFICLIVSFVVLPFALKPARTGSMANSIMAGLTIGFTYYAVQSFSIAMGRAEIWPPLLAAWMANIVMGFVAIIFNLGAEAPH